MWKVPQIWKGGDVYIIGGGYSIVEQFNIPTDIVNGVQQLRLDMASYSPYLSFLHNKHVIGVNAAYRLGNWVDILHFGDSQFFLNNRKQLAQFKGIKTSCHPRFRTDEFKRDVIKYIAKDLGHGRGITKHRNKVSWNSSSGAAAISIAAHTGAKRIFLLGFDMSLQNNKKHFHAHYLDSEYQSPTDPRALPFNIHLSSFGQIAQDAKDMGIKLYNVSPKSAITCIEKINLTDIK